MRVVALCALVAGCHFAPAEAQDAPIVMIDAPVPIDTPDAPPDGPPDAPPDAPPSCYGFGVAVVCLDTAPIAPYPGGNLDILTDAGGPLCRTDVTTPADNSLCVVAFTDLTVTGMITAHGSRPLVLISSGAADITGTIDVGSHSMGPMQVLGPGATMTGCNAATNGMDHSGGAGGSFIGLGGNGGRPDGMGTTRGAAITPTAMRGGCPGSDGLTATLATMNHGAGGGGLALLVTATLTVDGSIDAGGAAARGGSGAGFQGGGGAGSGGMIVIVAGSLAGSGQIFAPGGGGGEGGEDDGLGGGGQHTGGPGSDPATGNLATGAPGGNGQTAMAGAGGAGSSSTKALATDGSSGTSGVNDGGGGGGGGGGLVALHAGASTFSGTFSPPVTNN